MLWKRWTWSGIEDRTMIDVFAHLHRTLKLQWSMPAMFRDQLTIGGSSVNKETPRWNGFVGLSGIPVLHTSHPSSIPEPHKATSPWQVSPTILLRARFPKDLRAIRGEKHDRRNKVNSLPCGERQGEERRIHARAAVRGWPNFTP